jgi:hypothetical protein
MATKVKKFVNSQTGKGPGKPPSAKEPKTKSVVGARGVGKRA